MIITIILCFCLIIFIGKTSISFSPFKITCDQPYQMVGYIFLVLALACISLQSYNNGVRDTVKEIKEMFDKK